MGASTSPQETVGRWSRRRVIMKRRERAAKLAIVVVLAGATLVLAENRKEYRFKVGRHASVTVMNQYGPISVKPGAVKEVIVTATTYSDKVEVDHSQSGSRIDIVSHLLPGVGGRGDD